MVAWGWSKRLYMHRARRDTCGGVPSSNPNPIHANPAMCRPIAKPADAAAENGQKLPTSNSRSCPTQPAWYGAFSRGASIHQLAKIVCLKCKNVSCTCCCSAGRTAGSCASDFWFRLVPKRPNDQRRTRRLSPHCRSIAAIFGPSELYLRSICTVS